MTPLPWAGPIVRPTVAGVTFFTTASTCRSMARRSAAVLGEGTTSRVVGRPNGRVAGAWASTVTGATTAHQTHAARTGTNNPLGQKDLSGRTGRPVIVDRPWLSVPGR